MTAASAAVNLFICMLVSAACLAQATNFNFNRGVLPNSFSRNQSYPSRGEDDVCRPIRVRIERNSFRYSRDLRSNYNNKLTFANRDARRMTSRCQSRLDTLAASYMSRYRQKLNVLLAWVDSTSGVGNTVSNTSLHFEGRSVLVKGYINSISHHSDLIFMALEAGFDWVYLESSSSIRLSVVPDLCTINMDLVWILDQSGSVGRSNHGTALNFINSVHNFFDISLTRTRVGMVTYSTRARIAFDLDRYTSRSSLQRSVRQIRYPGGYTRTAQALQYATYLFDEDRGNTGVRPRSEGIPRVAVLITDGRANLQPLADTPDELKAEGVVVYSVGIGNVDLDELVEISSDPDALYVYLLTRYTDANSFVDLLGATLCESPAVVITGSFVLTRVGRAEFKYFQSTCGRFTRNTTVIIEVVDTVGFSFVYVSTAIPNPGPVSPRPYVVANSNAAFKRKRRLVTVSFHAEFTFTRMVYITVEGMESTNEFTMTVYEMLFQPDILERTVVGNTPPAPAIIDLRDHLTSSDPFKFEITEGNEAGRFIIAESTGVIRAGQALDPQDALLYNLTVVAENTLDPCQRTRAYVVVRVTPPNANAPAFPAPMTVTILETTPNQAEVAVVVATDADAGTSGDLTYSIVGGNTNGVFDIVTGTGSVVVVMQQFLNRSQYQNDFTLQIRATDGGSPSRSADTTLTIRVSDVNEAPYFTTPCALNGTCVYQISEGASPADAIGPVEATDVDPSPNGDLSYAITMVTDDGTGLFDVTSDGNLVVGAGTLDYEGRVNSFQVHVAARDEGNPSLSAVTVVTVELLNVNDSPPTLMVTSPQSVSEDFRGLVQTVIASDPDGLGTLTFSLTGSNLFAIGSASGAITVVGAGLDYEVTTMHSVTVMVTDGTLSSSAPIVFNVLDVNDNSPYFVDTPYSTSVTEEQALNLFFTVSAMDDDSGSNAAIKYSTNTAPFFFPDENSGQLSAPALDREMVGSHQVVVVARDCGVPPRSTSVIVRVTVTDINDNAPTFGRPLHRRSFSEDVGTPREVVRVTATDRDQPETDNSRFDYSINPSNALFTVDEGGVVRLVASLDFETQTSHNLTVYATDRGSPVMSGSTLVLVTVVDVNDNLPSITDRLVVNISESAAVGTSLATLSATDVDSSSQLTFSIVSGNEGGHFSINTTSGLLALAAQLDYEQQQLFTLNVSVTDNGGNSDYGTLVVNVINENDNTPAIQAPPTVSVDEEGSPGSEVFSVNATDGDLPPFNTLTLSVTSSPTNHFNIDSDGRVTVATRIDREALHPENRLLVTVVASDGELSSTATITVMIDDINDNAPVYDITQRSVSFREGQGTDIAVTTATASDLDLGSNAEIVYSIPETVPFSVNNETGVVTTTRILDREAGDEMFTFSILATDRGVPSMMSQPALQVTVTILDVNDNAPAFNSSPSVRREENSGAGLELARVFAEDADQGINGQFTLVILSGNVGNTFTLGQNGVLSTAQSLNFEQRSQYTVVIAAVDMGTPALTGTTIVTVTVDNIDESPPRFSLPCNITVDEFPVASPDRQLLLTCPAIDYDDGRVTGFTVIYALVSVNGQITELNHPFSLDVRTGEIFAVRDVDFEDKQNWVLRVRASDPTLNSADADVVIAVRDVNDNTPTFTDLNPHGYFYSSFPQRTVALLNIEDHDTGINGIFQAVLVGFAPSAGGGDSVFDVTINATDFGTPALTGSLTFPVELQAPAQPCAQVSFSLEHQRGERSAAIRIHTLCSFAQAPQSANLVEGQNHTFRCVASGNQNITYRWIHNGSVISDSSLSGDLALTDLQFSNAGEYACLADSAIGSLQSTTVTATILVAPLITIPPSDQAVEIGRTVAFTCVSTGSPPPSNAFDHRRRFVTSPVLDLQDEGRIRVTQSLLFISTVAESDDGHYRCIATNTAGMATSDPARLFIIGVSNLIEITVEEVQSPDSQGGSCQEFNTATFASSATQASGGTLEMHVVNTTGDNICRHSSCSPNPCRNGAGCAEDNSTTAGFVCTCLDGWTGDVCGVDVNECENDPCLFDGNCTNSNGSFSCACDSAHFGPTCKYSHVCNASNCLSHQICLETVVTTTGYECVDNTSVSVVMVTGSAGVTSNDIDTTIEASNLQNPIPFASGVTARRRRRQQPADQRCEVRAVQMVTMETNSFMLYFICPAGAPPPSTGDFTEICQLLLSNGRLEVCQHPDGFTLTAPKPVELDPARITVSFIVTGSASSQALEAGEGVKELEALGVLDVLKEQGYQVLAPEPADPQRATVPPIPADPAPIGVIVGVIVGLLGAVALVLAGVVIVMCCCSSKASGKIVMSPQNAKRRMSFIARPKSMFVKMASVLHKVAVIALSFSTVFLLSLANIPDEIDDAYFERDYSLLKPFQSHNWDMYGSTIVTPDCVRLTSDRQSKRGSIWSKVPVTMHNWEVSLHFAVHGSGDLLYGDGFAFWYTKDRGVEGPVFGSRDFFTGLGIFFDTYSNQNGPHEHDHPFISTMVANGSVHYDHDRDGTHGQINGCHCKFRAREHDTFVIVSYIDKVLSIFTSVDGDDDWNECFSAQDVYLPTGYYFGFSAATGDLADNHDIINVKVFDVDEGENPEWETAIPHADNAEPPRHHVDDVPPAMGHRSWLLFKVLAGLAFLAIVGGGIGYVVYAKKKEQARKRFY